MLAKKTLIIGHSHTVALMTATTVDDTFEFYKISQSQDIEPLRGFNAEDYAAVVLSIGGSYHNGFSLVNHPELFDFYLPEQVDLPIRPHSRLLPVALVEKVLERMRMGFLFSLTADIAKLFQGNSIYHIESPPPLPEAHIRSHPGLFKEKIDAFGISPAAFRYKVWRLHSKMVRENCGRLGIQFIDVPPEAQSSDGLLRDEYCHIDTGHANPLYGDLVLKQIRKIPALAALGSPCP